jgi:hypothetical protein
MPKDAPKMARQLHIPVPGDVRTVHTPHRHSEQALIGNRQRLDPNSGVLIVPRGARCSSQESRAERQNAIPIVGCAFRKEHHGIALCHPACNRVSNFCRLRSPGAVDEHRPLKLGKQTKDRPAGNFRLGNKGQRHQRTDNGDIHPGCMVGGNQQRTFSRRLVRPDECVYQQGRLQSYATDEEGVSGLGDSSSLQPTAVESRSARRPLKPGSSKPP